MTLNKFSRDRAEALYLAKPCGMARPETKLQPTDTLCAGSRVLLGGPFSTFGVRSAPPTCCADTRAGVYSKA